MKKLKKLIMVGILGGVMLGGMTGCTMYSKIETNQVGLMMGNGTSIDSVKTAGRVTNLSPFSHLEKIDCSVKNGTWSGTDIFTKDDQPIAVSVSFKYHRNQNEEKVKQLYMNYKTEALNDEALAQLVKSFVPDAVKTVIPSKSLEHMLRESDNSGGRAAVASAIKEQLSKDLDSCGLVLDSLLIDDIDPSVEYKAILQTKANSIANAAATEQKRLEIIEQQKLEEQTKILEIAKAQRENEVKAEQSKVYQESAEAFEIRKLELMAQVIGKNDKIYFVPEGSNITLYLAGQSGETTSNDTTPDAPTGQ